MFFLEFDRYEYENETSQSYTKTRSCSGNVAQTHIKDVFHLITYPLSFSVKRHVETGHLDGVHGSRCDLKANILLSMQLRDAHLRMF